MVEKIFTPGSEDYPVYLKDGVYYFPIIPGHGNALEFPVQLPLPPLGQWVAKEETGAYYMFNILGETGLRIFAPKDWENIALALSAVSSRIELILPGFQKNVVGAGNLHPYFYEQRKAHGLFTLEELESEA